MPERRWSDADRELVADALASRVPYPQHSQTCRVWTLRPRGVKVGDGTTPSPAALARCGCWVVDRARRDAAVVLDALTAAGKLRTGDPAATFDQFWADLVLTDGQLDPDKVRAELHDYYLVMGEVSKVYMELTDGRISKPNTLAHHVIGEANEASERAVRVQVAEEIAEDLLSVAGREGGLWAAVIARAHRTTPGDDRAQ